MPKRPLEFVISAGPTREHIDPVRFLSNPSTGKMGFAVARAAAEAGFKTSLIAGPVSLSTPRNVERVNVVSACEMLEACKAKIASAKGGVVFISTAAVADFRPAVTANKKIKKGSAEEMTLRLVKNPDILKTLSAGKRDGLYKDLSLIGFAAETGSPAEEASRKCREKNLDFIVANDVSMPGSGFAVNTNRASIVFPDGTVEDLALMTKLQLARKIVALAIKGVK
ncbi:MAG: hypothetical protein J6S51_01750 [Kiritimatiellae bacterium]|nr:hypothetical protein [Kiritimatiellia bacterium]